MPRTSAYTTHVVTDLWAVYWRPWSPKRVCDWESCRWYYLQEFRAFELLRSGADRANYLLVKEAKIIAMTCTHAALKRRDLVNVGFQVGHGHCQVMYSYVSWKQFLSYSVLMTMFSLVLHWERVIRSAFCIIVDTITDRVLKASVSSWYVHLQVRASVFCASSDVFFFSDSCLCLGSVQQIDMYRQE